jgi:hypothetical protein
MIAKIIKAYTREYSDSGQITSYVEWLDYQGKTGRTEGRRANPHMDALFRRATQDGAPITTETW